MIALTNGRSDKVDGVGVHTGKTFSIYRDNYILKKKKKSDNLGHNVAYSLTQRVRVCNYICVCMCVLMKSTLETSRWFFFSSSGSSWVRHIIDAAQPKTHVYLE